MTLCLSRRLDHCSRFHGGPGHPVGWDYVSCREGCRSYSNRPGLGGPGEPLCKETRLVALTEGVLEVHGEETAGVVVGMVLKPTPDCEKNGHVPILRAETELDLEKCLGG